MNSDWETVVGIVEAAGLNGVELAATAYRRGVSAEAVLEGIMRTIELGAERGDGDPYPFTIFEATPPGMVDLRVLDQETWWVDQLRVPHLIQDRDDFTDHYLANVIRHLIRMADFYWLHVIRYEPEAAASEPVCWMKATILMGALRQEASIRLRSDLARWRTNGDDSLSQPNAEAPSSRVVTRG